jgi:hypothetical protein
MVDTTAPTLTTPTAISLTDTAITDTYADQTGTLSATDPENAAVTYGIEHGTVTGSTSELVGHYGTLSLDTSSGAYTYTPNATAINALTSDASESFTVTASDSGNNVSFETLTVSVTGANDAAVITGNVSATFGISDTSASGTLSSADVDGTANLFQAQTAVAGLNGYGTFTIGTDGTWSYAADPTRPIGFDASVLNTDHLNVAAADGTLQDLIVTYPINYVGF